MLCGMDEAHLLCWVLSSSALPLSASCMIQTLSGGRRCLFLLVSSDRSIGGAHPGPFVMTLVDESSFFSVVALRNGICANLTYNVKEEGALL
jgi:hypothetical protein